MKVVCVKPFPPSCPGYVTPRGIPVVDGIYTVVHEYKECDVCGESAYILEEVVAINLATGEDDGFIAENFVPLDYWKAEFHKTADVRETVTA